MRNILIIILFATGLMLTSCSKSSPEPTCEDGGTEVDCMGIENGLAAVDDSSCCHESYMYLGNGTLTPIASYADTAGLDGLLILAGSAEDIANNPSWNTGCK